MKDFLSFRLAVQQGRVDLEKHPKIRAEMDRINERFPRITHKPTCTTCGGELNGNQLDVCPVCARRLAEIWPGCQEFERDNAVKV